MVSIWIIIAPLYTAHEITVQGSIIVNVIVVVILVLHFPQTRA